MSMYPFIEYMSSFNHYRVIAQGPVQFSIASFVPVRFNFAS